MVHMVTRPPPPLPPPQLASNISSFAICNNFLLVTTHAHSCRCLQLNGLSVKGAKPPRYYNNDDNNNNNNNRCCSYEQYVLLQNLSGLSRLLYKNTIMWLVVVWDVNVLILLCMYIVVHVTFNPTELQSALASGDSQNDETLRRVERGSRIVTVVPQDTRVILQVSLSHSSAARWSGCRFNGIQQVSG